MSAAVLSGWELLRHGGLLLDPPRLQRLAQHAPAPLNRFHAQELRRAATALLAGDRDVSEFVAFVLEHVCGFTSDTDTWLRGPAVGTEWTRRTPTGESVKPRHLWRGSHGVLLPVFIDAEKQLGIGRGRRAPSQVVQWLRSGTERLALLTNGRQWRLIFAGLDFDAWCEWDVDLWFEEGELSPQVGALRTLVSPLLWTPPQEGRPTPLLAAVLDSRKGQAELSAALGERVREAVELLVQAHGEVLSERCPYVAPADVYRAAVRVVMRLVVVLFAESRELLPRDNSLYHAAYGVGGLMEELEKVAARGGNRLARSWSAWPRLLALFRLVHEGSHHPSLPVPAYGGELFAQAEPAADGLSKALAVFESAAFEHELFPDRDVHWVLERITRTRVRLRQGRASIWVTAPVDFSDLSSEYIGILYEGLLDFELKTAPGGDPVIFLAVGNQPALPLSRLEAMDDRALKSLLEKMKDTSTADDDESSREDESAKELADDVAADADANFVGDSGEDTDEDSDAEAPEVEHGADEPADHRHVTRTRAEAWARRAVEIGGMVRRPRGRLTPERERSHEETVSRKARQLVVRVVLPGEWYLVRWGGTRKGSGTFYTRPGLAVPTVQRTLRPLAWTPPLRADGGPDSDAPTADWMPKLPEEILTLKVCDPASGSGTFPVAALRFLTEALYAAVHHHGRVSDLGDRSVVSLLRPIDPAAPPGEALGRELIPCRPGDGSFEPRLKAVLRRHVVERCIYGVDLDPLAVELCRLALWIETMDRTLPFSFLDHKVKCGNALVGAWFDSFRHFPVMAFKNREGGDKGHANGVHFKKEVRTKALKTFASGPLKDDLARFLVGPTLFDSRDQVAEAAVVHDDALDLLAHLHDLPVHDAAERARIYRDELLGAPAYRRLRKAMDLWCACWFWPAEELDNAPLPSTLAAPPDATRVTAARIAARLRFFHWELEFPDVFHAPGTGFDAVLGNPPWDIAKPNSKEFFSNIDPLYRAYGKQEALRAQTEYFTDASVEREWLDYNADFRAQSSLMKYATAPFGDPVIAEVSTDRFSIARGRKNDTLHERWRAIRAKSKGYADPMHPFWHQGSADINLYKAFLEQSHALLRQGGRLGFVVPFGLCCDDGCTDLRKLFIDRCSWEWLFGFENRESIFGIDPRNKFNAIVIEKNGTTKAIRAAFMRRSLRDWERAEEIVAPYTKEQLFRFSPRSSAFLEVQSTKDLDLLEKIYANSVLLGDDGPDRWGVKYASEFHMTNDSKLFPLRSAWEARGYLPDEYGRWLKVPWHDRSEESAAPLARRRADIDRGIVLSADGSRWADLSTLQDAEFPHPDKKQKVIGPEVALPLYQGPMVFDWSPNAATYDRGGNSGAVWTRNSDPSTPIRPQYLMGKPTFVHSNAYKAHKVVYRTLSNPMSNERSAIPVCLPPYPCGNSLGVLVLQGRSDLKRALALSAVMGSFVFDWVLRMRLSSMNINAFYLREMCVLQPSQQLSDVIALLCARLSFPGYRYSAEWLRFPNIHSPAREFALTEHERLRLQVVMAAVTFALWGLSEADLPQLLAYCDLPTSISSKRDAVRDISSKGLWRIGRFRDPEIRSSILSVPAFHDLKARVGEEGGDLWRGINSFLSQNDGEGWMLPKTLCLADYGLGRDQRARDSQPVVSRLGPRFYDWQLTQSAEESWRECHLHARNLLGEAGYRELLSEIDVERRGEQPQRAPHVSEPAASRRSQGTLFD